MAIERCRIWWPRRQPQFEHNSGSVPHILFGWLFTGAGSLDAVVSAAVPQDQILRAFTTLDALQSTVFSSNKRMPVSLQESATFIILGDCVMHNPRELEEDCCSKQEQHSYNAQFVQKGNSSASRKNMSGSFLTEDQRPTCDDRKCVCISSALDGFLDTYRKSAVKEDSWMHFSSDSGHSFKRNLNQIPVLCHLYLQGQKIKMNYCHIILYDVPTIGINHFSLGLDAPRKLKAFSRKPNWITDLQKKPPVLDLGPIVLALNCSSAARLPITQEYLPKLSRTHFFLEPVFDILLQASWNCMGVFLASASTFLYINVILFQKCCYQSLYLMLQKVFRNSWNTIHLRSCQVLYWPVVLQDPFLRWHLATWLCVAHGCSSWF